jgi:hypothetical protein
MGAPKKCKRSVSNCSYCVTGHYKRPARKAARAAARRDLRQQLAD